MSSDTTLRAIYRPIETLPRSADLERGTLPEQESRYVLASRLGWLLDEYNESIEENAEDGLPVPGEEEKASARALISSANSYAGQQGHVYSAVDLYGRLQVLVKVDLSSCYLTMTSPHTLSWSLFHQGRLLTHNERLLAPVAKEK